MIDYSSSYSVLYKGVMVSSTFTDLTAHREALIKAILRNEMMPVCMENNDAPHPDGDVLDYSLRMVRQASGYIGVISRKYGQIPECPCRNPEGLSLTQLEFNEARRLGRPVLLFIMGDDHLLKDKDVEVDPVKRKKLEAFREEAKRIQADALVHRIYKVFNDLRDFELAAMKALAELSEILSRQRGPSPQPLPTPDPLSPPVPIPPTFYAKSSYIAMHRFVGRRAQLDDLNDWAASADPHPILLFDAIGGSGKSIMTWEWATMYAPTIRGDWAGRFWYSFYEQGATMADFCRYALSYITSRSPDDFKDKDTPNLTKCLQYHLKARPWLIVLDGMERVLVAYHRFDAAQVPDEKANILADQIAHRDPCAAVCPDDDKLLLTLVAAAPSKILITSRLVPRVLFNTSNQPIPGVRRIALPGLRPSDAEALLRSCGVRGDSQAIQAYLTTHSDCHPLVTGVLAGLINN